MGASQFHNELVKIDQTASAILIVKTKSRGTVDFLLPISGAAVYLTLRWHLLAEILTSLPILTGSSWKNIVKLWCDP